MEIEVLPELFLHRGAGVLSQERPSAPARGAKPEI
jgi:hypothetical protein